MEEGRPYLFRWPGLPEFLPGFQGVCQCWVFCGVQVFPWWSSATSGVVPITVLEPAYLLWPPLGPGETHILFPQAKGVLQAVQLALDLTVLQTSSCPERSQQDRLSPYSERCPSRQPGGLCDKLAGKYLCPGVGLGFPQSRGPPTGECTCVSSSLQEVLQSPC